MARWIFGPILVAAVAACDAKPMAGGSTEDFNGNGPPCRHAISVPLDKPRAKFAAAVQQVRDLIEGDYAVPITWVHPCSPEFECRLPKCGDVDDAGMIVSDAGEIPLVSTEFTDTETVLRIGIHATGEAATILDEQVGAIMDAREGEASCRESLRIPVIVTLSSDDGALNEEFAVDIRTEDLTVGRIDFDELYPISRLDGSFSERLPSNATMLLRVNTHLEADGSVTYSHDISIRDGHNLEESSVLLGSSIRMASTCPQEILRDSVRE